jgi:hypothetical protein
MNKPPRCRFCRWWLVFRPDGLRGSIGRGGAIPNIQSEWMENCQMQTGILNVTLHAARMIPSPSES